MPSAPRTSKAILATALAALVWMTAPSLALAALDDRVVTLQVHEDPADPQSPIRLTFTLEITAAARDGDAIGWQIKSVEVTENGRDGTIARSWSDTLDPATDPTQFWWVTHADPENPSPKEFLDVPQLQGTAAPRQNTDTPLRYALVSTGAVDSLTGEKAAFATYSLAYESSPGTPLVEGEEEPVESSGGRDG